MSSNEKESGSSLSNKMDLLSSIQNWLWKNGGDQKSCYNTVIFECERWPFLFVGSKLMSEFLLRIWPLNKAQNIFFVNRALLSVQPIRLTMAAEKGHNCFGAWVPVRRLLVVYCWLGIESLLKCHFESASRTKGHFMHGLFSFSANNEPHGWKSDSIIRKEHGHVVVV